MKRPESSLTSIYLIQGGRFRYVNPALARMFGYIVGEVVDRLGPLDLVYPDDRPIVAENIRRRVAGEVGEIRCLWMTFFRFSVIECSCSRWC